MRKSVTGFNKEFFDAIIEAKDYRDLEKVFPEIHNAAVFDNAMVGIGEQRRFIEADENGYGEKVINIRNDNSASKDGRSRYALKELVAKAYEVENPNNYEYIDYIDGNMLNCRPENLKYVEENPYPAIVSHGNGSTTYVIVDNKNNILETAKTIEKIQELSGYKDKTKFRGGICGFRNPLPTESNYPGCFVGKRDGEEAIEFAF